MTDCAPLLAKMLHLLLRRASVRAAVLLLMLLVARETRGDELRLVEVMTTVNSRHLTTTVTATLVNPGEAEQELVCRLDLPSRAYVTNLVIDVGGRNHTSSVQKRGRRSKRIGSTQPEASLANYFSIRKREGGLQRFRATATVAGKSEVKFYLTYEEVLKRNKGAYNPTFFFPPSQRVVEVSLSLMVKEVEPLAFAKLLSVPSNASSSQALDSAAAVVAHIPGSNFALVSYSSASDALFTRASRDLPPFHFSYDVERKPDGGELQVSGTNFVLFFAPEGLPGLTKHTVFVLDISGSMDDNNKLDHLKEAMKAILNDFKTQDSFQLVFLTDGKPTVSEKNSDVIRRNVREANVNHFPIFALAFGPDAELKFLRQICADNTGTARRITDRSTAAEQIKDFFDEVSRPLLSDVAIRFPEGQLNQSSLVKLGQDTYYAGDEIVFAGQLASEEDILDPSIEGAGADGPVTLKVSRRHSSPPTPPNPDLQRVWAYLAVQDLLDSQDVVEDPNLRSEMRARALHIALMNGFVTKFTGLAMHPSSSPDNDDDSDDAVNDEPSSETTTARSPPLPPRPLPLHPHDGGESGGRALPHSAGDVTLLSKEDLAASLPSGLIASLGATQNRRFSFVDNDPHFVVQVPGLVFPLCFDVHGQHGDILSVINDPKSGIRVSGVVTAVVGSEGKTYFTKLFVALGHVNVTVTPDTVTVDCLRNGSIATVSEVSSDPAPTDRRRRHQRTRNRGRGTRHAGNRRHRRQHRRHKRNHRSHLSLPSATYSANPHPQILFANAYHNEKISSLVDRPRHISEHRHPQLQFAAALDSHFSKTDEQGDFDELEIHPHFTRHQHDQFYSPNRSPLLHTNNKHEPLSTPELDRHSPLTDRSPPISVLELHPHSSDSNSQPPKGSTRLSEGRKAQHVHPTAGNNEHPEAVVPEHFHYFSPSMVSRAWNFTSVLEKLGEEPENDEELFKLRNEINTRFDGKLGSESHIPNKNQRKNSLNAAKFSVEEDDQAGSIYSDGEIHYKRTDSPVMSRHISTSIDNDIEDEDSKILDYLVEKCQQELTWDEISGRRFDNVVFRVRNNRKLNIMMGDLEVHFTITRTKNRHDQHFLGFYVEEQNVLSPLTTGIIGQFAFKTVTLKQSTSPSRRSSQLNMQPGPNEASVELLVLHVGEDGGGGARISEVRANVEHRRSLLHKVHVPCLYVDNEGRGLLTHPASEYTVPCLQC
ncbi:inter-alpha-trypsin inhibitor heavy chain H3 [Hyalella azteca]|uniref:Inter-alpha-trypsin inhibitor heavy chain H3 n=1 Tax=Hyalella azteca TaxID=294128 RepID=A0A8B7NSQ4_HYAAZ|nr:inter-alpha-trypsin inhibitor heavy chain H3 [Hyalella azteca]